MAAETSRGAASSSTPRLAYDVFLNFRGEDTRKSFTDHLHSALKRKGIIVFRDDEKLERGRNIRSKLLTAIQESEYAVTVISEDYASSTWCLDELSEIVRCKKEKGLKILPVFYKVNTSDIRKQKGSFEEAVAKHATDNFDEKRTKMWIDALNEVCGISGYDIGDRHESDVVDEICTNIFNGLSRQLLEIDTDLVGIEFQIGELMTRLDISDNDVQFIGICGMGGIGKTTLAEVVYSNVCSRFDASCFISNVREKSQNCGSLIPLQKELISQIFEEKEPKICNAYQGQRLIARLAKNKNVFIVLDDVDKEEQLDKLVGKQSWFGKGTRVLVTSRDGNLLNRYVDQIYTVESLSKNLALQLFNMKAFKQPYFEGNYVQFIEEILMYAGGLPLALKTFGSFLFGRKIDAWRSAIDRLKADPGSKIMNILKISFEGLDNSQQSLFLDIACFFKGKSINTSTYKLEALGHFPKIDIPNLVNKSLITITQHNKIEMHDLLQQMGHHIAHESQKELSKQSRLWHYEDIIHILKNKVENDAIESMALKIPIQNCLQQNLEFFSKMNNLKLLEITCSDYNVLKDVKDLNIEWEGDPLEFQLSNNLCVIKWWKYPLQCLPTSFQLDNLIVLSLPWSEIKLLWDGQKSLKKLKYVNLKKSSSLIKTPNFSGVSNLEKLNLSYCTSLPEIHSSIGFLRQLKVLKLGGCESLERLPNEMDLPSLQSLDLSECFMLEVFPNIRATSLQSLNLSGCLRLKEFPNNTTPSLQTLDLSGCSRLKSFSNIMAPSLQSLNLSTCKTLETFSNIMAPSLQILSLDGCLKLKTSSLPNITRLSLQTLNLSRCSKLEAFSNIMTPSLQTLDLYGCSRLKSFSNIMAPSLQSLNLSACTRLETFSNIVAPFLQILSLDGCSSLEASSLPNIILPSLQTLDLSRYSRLEAFSNITTPSLQTLDLCGCSRLESFSNIMAPSLQSLNLSACIRLETFSNITTPSLQILSLDGCSRLEAPSLPNIMVPSLQTLDLSRCSRLKSFSNIMAPSLQSLNLSACTRLEKFSNIVVPSLKILSLDGCSRLEALSLPNIMAPSLQTLDLCGCSRLECFSNIMVPSLQSLNLSACTRLETFSNIMVPSLQILSLGGCSRLEASSLPNIMASFLQTLDLSGCLRLEAFPNITTSSLQTLDLHGCSRLESFSNIIAPSLQNLNLSTCTRLQTFSNITAPSLQILSLDRCSRLETFVNITAPSLQTLNLSECSLNLFKCLRFDAFPNITAPFLHKLEAFLNITSQSFQNLNLSACPRLEKRLETSSNITTQSHDSLYLFGCSRKLSFGMKDLYHLVHPPGLLNNEVDMWTSTNILLIDDCSVLAVYFAADGKLYQTVHMDPRTLFFSFENSSCSNAMAWGPTLGFEIPTWFKHKSIGFFGSVQSGINVDLDDDLREWEWELEWDWKFEGYALFMVYEIHERDSCQKSKRLKLDEHGNSNSKTFDGNDPNFPMFLCQLQVNEGGPRFPIVFSVPEVPRYGLNGVWMFIKAGLFQELRKWPDKWSYIGASIVTRDSNVEVKECGARLVHTSKLAEFCEVLKGITPVNLDGNHGLQTSFCDSVFHNDTSKSWNISSFPR